MPVGDIRLVKQGLRSEIKARRRAIPPDEKERLDAQVRKSVLRLYQYQRARTVICYLSTPIEVDTRGIIEDALARGKRVALPRCVEGTRLMEFYLIRSFDELEKGSFGLLEPRRDCERLRDFSHSVCLVPALSFDRQGFRLGYGGGYYDRFLAEYRCPKVGMIYSKDIRPMLPHGRYDRPVDLIASDSGFFYIQKGRGPAKARGPRFGHAPRTHGHSGHTPHTGRRGP